MRVRACVCVRACVSVSVCPCVCVIVWKAGAVLLVLSLLSDQGSHVQHEHDPENDV